MGGMSLPNGFGLPGNFGSTVGMTGGQANYNPTTTAAVTNNKGDLTAFDPSTMHETRGATPVPETIAPPAGYGTSGLPDWQTNWLQTGGKSPFPMAAVSGDKAHGTLTPTVNKSHPATGEGAYRAQRLGPGTTEAPAKTTTPATPASTFVTPRQGPRPNFTPVGPTGYPLTMDMLDKVSDAGIQAILAGDYGHPDLQLTGAARFTKPDANFYKYATWRLGTAGLSAPHAATSDPYRLARNEPGAQLDANGRPYLNPGYYNSGYGGSNSS